MSLFNEKFKVGSNRYIIEQFLYLNGGGVGERDSGKLATSLDIARDLMEPKVCSGLRGAPSTEAIPL